MAILKIKFLIAQINKLISFENLNNISYSFALIILIRANYLNKNE